MSARRELSQATGQCAHMHPDLVAQTFQTSRGIVATLLILLPDYYQPRRSCLLRMTKIPVDCSVFNIQHPKRKSQCEKCASRDTSGLDLASAARVPLRNAFVFQKAHCDANSSSCSVFLYSFVVSDSDGRHSAKHCKLPAVFRVHNIREINYFCLPLLQYLLER